MQRLFGVLRGLVPGALANPDARLAGGSDIREEVEDVAARRGDARVNPVGERSAPMLLDKRLHCGLPK
eukprot:8615642-Pyramimonas_sp.AAC.1